MHNQVFSSAPFSAVDSCDISVHSQECVCVNPRVNQAAFTTAYDWETNDAVVEASWNVFRVSRIHSA